MELNLGKKLRQVVGSAMGAQIAEFHLEKAIKDSMERATAPTSVLYDPTQLFMGREWLVKKNLPLTFHDLRQMARNPILSSIIQTRINQVASFCAPQMDAYEQGYLIKSAIHDAKMDTDKTQELSQMVYNMGTRGYGEPLLETFIRKFLRDSLVLDQACAEIIPRMDGLPAYVVSIDSATIRRLPAASQYMMPPKGTPVYCQVIDDLVVTKYEFDKLMFGIRNPTSDMEFAGYGCSEMEVLVRIITTILNTERYNSGQLTQGGLQKGLLVVKGEIAQDNLQFESFKRDFREASRNAADAWRPPILRISKEGEVDWVTLDRTNKDMEFSHLFDFLVKQSCAVYQMSPEEINWQIGITGAHANFGSDYRGKIVHSQRKGLKPLLTFLSGQINDNFIQRIDPNYRLEFVGIDMDREIDSQINDREAKCYKTVNEVRAQLNLPPVKGGNIIMNQVYTNMLMFQATGQIPSNKPGGGMQPQAPPKNKGKTNGKVNGLPALSAQRKQPPKPTVN